MMPNDSGEKEVEMFEKGYRCRDKKIPAVNIFPPPVTLLSVLSAPCIAQN